MIIERPAMNAILNHARTDPNAPKHQAIGERASIMCASFALVVSYNHCPSLWGSLSVAFGYLLGGLPAGIGIELVQRWQRRGGKQNTLKESMLDAAVTWLHWLR